MAKRIQVIVCLVTETERTSTAPIPEAGKKRGVRRACEGGELHVCGTPGLTGQVGINFALGFLAAPSSSRSLVANTNPDGSSRMCRRASKKRRRIVRTLQIHRIGSQVDITRLVYVCSRLNKHIPNE